MTISFYSKGQEGIITLNHEELICKLQLRFILLYFAFILGLAFALGSFTYIFNKLGKIQKRHPRVSSFYLQ